MGYFKKPIGNFERRSNWLQDQLELPDEEVRNCSYVELCRVLALRLFNPVFVLTHFKVLPRLISLANEDYDLTMYTGFAFMFLGIIVFVVAIIF